MNLKSLRVYRFSILGCFIKTNAYSPVHVGYESPNKVFEKFVDNVFACKNLIIYSCRIQRMRVHITAAFVHNFCDIVCMFVCR